MGRLRANSVVESLEQRWTKAVDDGLTGTTLKIDGTISADTITVFPNSRGTHICVNTDSDSAYKGYFSASAVDEIRIDAGWGDDKVNVYNTLSVGSCILGSRGDDTLGGGGGSDTIYGEQGEDLIDGDDGQDWLSGDEDDDTLEGDAGDDFLYGGDGDDYLYGDSGNDWLQGQAGSDYIAGGTGIDTIYATGDCCVTLY